MTEKAFRSARLFKVIGSPLRYKILVQLHQGPKTPGELAARCRRPLPAVSRALTQLGWAGLVSYKTVGRAPVYELKQTELVHLLDHGEFFVHRFELPFVRTLTCPYSMTERTRLA